MVAVLANLYRQRLAKQAFDGTSAAKAGFMAFGDGGLAADGTVLSVDPDQTGLNHEVLRVPLLSSVQEDLYSVTCTGRMSEADSVGLVISEAALLDIDGKVIGIKNFGGKVKEDDETYDITIKIKH